MTSDIFKEVLDQVIKGDLSRIKELSVLSMTFILHRVPNIDLLTNDIIDHILQMKDDRINSSLLVRIVKDNFERFKVILNRLTLNIKIIELC